MTNPLSLRALVALAFLSAAGAHAQWEEPPADPVPEEPPPAAEAWPTNDNVAAPGSTPPQEPQLADALARIAALEARLDGPAQESGDDSAPQRFTLSPIVSSFTRIELRANYDDLGIGSPGCNGGDGDCFRYRARLGLDFNIRLNTKLQARVRFLPQFSGFMGSDAFSGGVVDPNIGLHEGSLRVQYADSFALEAGRFQMHFGEGTVIGSRNWTTNAQSFDGGRLQVHTEKLDLDAFFTILGESGDSDIARSDSYFYGVYAQLGRFLGERSVLDVYALGTQVNAVAGAVDWSLRVHLGARLKQRFGNLGLRFEGDVQVGRIGVSPDDANALIAGHILAEANVFLMEDRLQLGVEAAFASGDNPDSDDRSEAYFVPFANRHGHLGLADVMGLRTNIAHATVHFRYRTSSRFSLGVDGTMFLRPINANGAYTGIEADFFARWQPADGLYGTFTYALFIPDHDAFGSSDVVHYVEIQAGYDFN